MKKVLDQRAVHICCKSEYLLMNAAMDGNYVPAGRRPGAGTPNAHTLHGERGWGAEVKRNEIRALYEKIYGRLTVHPLYTDDSSEFIVRHLYDEDCGEYAR
jgi:hypothetical protein